MKKFEELEAVVASMKADVEKFGSKGNASAGSRLRKALQEVKVLAQDLRKEIQEIKNSAKGK